MKLILQYRGSKRESIFFPLNGVEFGNGCLYFSILRKDKVKVEMITPISVLEGYKIELEKV